MNQELIDYVKQQLGANVPKKKIDGILSRQGWRQDEIEEAFLAAQGESQPVGTSQNDPLPADPGPGSALGSGAGRKIILCVAIALAIAAVVAAIFIMASLGSEKNNIKNNEMPPAPAANSDNSEPSNNNAAAANSDQKNSENLTSEQITATINDMAKKLQASIQPPDGWRPGPAPVALRPVANFYKPVGEKNSQGKNIFSEKITVSIDNYRTDGAGDAASYLAASKKKIQASIENYKVASEKKAKLSDGTEATLIEGSYAQDGNNAKIMQLYAFKGDYVYIVAGTTLVSNWEKEKDMVGAAIMSFRFPEGL